LNPPMLRLAGEIADGVLLNYSPPEAIPPMIEEIRAGAEKAGRKLTDIDISIYLRMCITEDEKAAVMSFKRELATYAFVDQYNAMFERYGLQDEFAEVRRLWREGKRDDAPNALSDSSARRLAAFGPPAAGRKFIESFRAVGVNHPVIFPIGPGKSLMQHFKATVEAVAGA
jgi:alkanesulfonate monooxygenase SsuD/methylene tetrahydromethanopterin reductase-like flavin-dependent oxidoreductase (luciferase family)